MRPDVVPPQTVDEPEDRSTITWGVGAVAERLEIAASTLRTWERRYGVGPSHRTQGGHRRYTERDIDRVELLRRLVARGVSAQDAARVTRSLDPDNLAAALAEPDPGRVSSTDPAQLVDSVMKAASTLDGRGIHELVAEALRRESFLETWRGILAPALMRIATESSAGSLDAEAVELATRVVMNQVAAVRPAMPTETADVVLVTSDRTIDSLPLVAIDAALRSADVSTRFIDASMPAASVRGLVDRLDPEVVVLWSSSFGAAVLEATLSPGSSVLRASPAWPHEMSLSVGDDDRAVSMTVATATDHVLDRLRGKRSRR
ncbi:hypothetical protein ASD11_15425 [Aeromicrobium sp. Root495]|nr:hypothetical protein ASD11_15425 [Aeromicrobium sp. Root495]